MRSFSLLISKYTLQAVLPYFVFTWLLLSVILFVQQSSRYSELLFNTNLPNFLIWQLTVALIPSVIAFTCPVAILVGVIIGISRMQGDSEMTSIRAAGVGNLQIAIPILFLGVILSAFALFINLKGVPIAAQVVRQVALKAALYKLESPIEPGVFNSEINDFTIYVKNGNIEKGTWENVFIYQEDKSINQLRLITSKEGRIDTSNEISEIVLQNASVTTLEPSNENKIISENVKSFRLVINTKRGELIEKIAKTKETPEEMGLIELAQFLKKLQGKEKIEAQILLQRRILLSITPLIFALLGLALVTKYNRGGRGVGVFLSLLSLVTFYLITLMCEQLARTETINVLTSSLIPLSISIVAITWLLISSRYSITRTIKLDFILKNFKTDNRNEKVSNKLAYIDRTTGLLDYDLVWELIKNYILTLGFLITFYLIFTAFELWKFAGTFENGIYLLIIYLFYLIPFIYIQLAPSALMIATLVTYIIKSRQNEIVTWAAAGQSVYRLLFPCFILMIMIGFLNLGIQEFGLTKANRMQDSLRDQIRSRGTSSIKKEISWVSKNNLIYSFTKNGASDNQNNILNDLQIIEFDKDNQRLVSLIKVKEATVDGRKIRFLSNAEKIVWGDGQITINKISEYEISENAFLFKENITKPSHLNIQETKQKIAKTQKESEQIIFAISLQKKYVTPFLPLIIILFTAPFALSIGRKGNVLTIGYAIGLWLLFMGITTIFDQFGQSEFISPTLSVWSPMILFTIVGMLFLTKVKT